MKYMKKFDFSQKNQNHIICSIKMVNLWKTVLIIPVYRYSFAICDQRKKISSQQLFPFPPLGEAPPTI